MADPDTIKPIEIFTLIALLVGPLLGVWFTIWWQDRKEKRDAKQRSFLTLMAHRKAHPPSPDWVDALNVLDVVWASEPKVLDLWHTYYSHLNGVFDERTLQPREHSYLQMLSAMAKCLGYDRIEQTDIDKFYAPKAHIDQHSLNAECQFEWLRVLKNTASLTVEPQPKKDNSAKAPISPSTPNPTISQM